MVDCIYGFDEADKDLSYLPMAARRALDAAGFKLSLKGWQSLPVERRWALAQAGAETSVDTRSVSALIANAAPQPTPVPIVLDPSPEQPPADLLVALGSARPLDVVSWSSRRALDRYVLYKLFTRGREEKLARAFDEIFALPHRNAEGEARMVDIHQKSMTHRRALASARLNMSPATLQRLLEGEVSKGDVLAVARVAGIQAAKRTSELIPLCHTIALTRVAVEFVVTQERGEIVIQATADAIDRTGVEMEAMVAASMAALTLYDMVKSMDRWMTITEVRLEEKSGGKSGILRRDSP